MLIFRRQVTEDFCQTGENPAVAACPEILLAVDTLMFRIYIFAIPKIKTGLVVKHDTVADEDVIVKFVKIFAVSGNLIHFCHHRHHHIQSVCPPPVIILRRGHLIFHYFPGAAYTSVIGKNIVKIRICLETYLPVAEKHMLVGLSVIIFPFAPVLALSTLPPVMVCPGEGIVKIVLIPGKAVSLHISGVIRRHMPERPLGGIVRLLPGGIDLIYYSPYLLRLVSRARP